MNSTKNMMTSLFSKALTSLPEQPSSAKSLGRVLLVASSTNTLQLKNYRVVPTGYSLEDLTVPVQQFIEAGYEVVIATPDGKKPVILAHANDSRFDNDPEALQRAIAFLDSYPSMQNLKTLKAVLSEGLDRYIGVYVPGGYAPMNDLMQDPDLGQILRYFHKTSKPSAFLSHGSVAMLAALPDTTAYRKALVDGDREAAKTAAADWQYAGYRMTSFSNEEEYPIEREILDGQVPFYVADALASAGGRVEHGSSDQSFVVQDRELISGQNLASDRAIAQEFVEALDEARVIPIWVRKHFLGKA
ncbi:type 1 glutamine amidotransferase domain-containing protein [Coleofasciculus sp. FACHB-64]|uniref:type 1 glutamine amidotransferase domain-containing protein n=1 Tax=Cyanophyceae TaxID=3028117 RepID=UPI0018F03398|nr:type 1 glutamine amidotransferase domain-containing protein [Coleofasciculus sp. FACHB-64]